MFGLDKLVFGLIYNACTDLGAIFGLGPFEGFVLYGGILSSAAIKVLDGYKKGVRGR